MHRGLEWPTLRGCYVAAGLGRIHLAKLSTLEILLSFSGEHSLVHLQPRNR